MILAHIEQGSDEWRAARCGVVTASQFKAVMTKGRGKTRAEYLRRLRDEIITGRPTPPTFQSPAMQRGNDLEPVARQAYQEKVGHNVHEVGIVYLDGGRRVAASPDGLIGDKGGLEIKCPLPHNHQKYMRDGRVPPQYMAQIQGNLWVTGRAWWDFVSFAPEFAPDYRIMVRRVQRDEVYISALEREISRFVEDLDNAVRALL